MRGEGQDPESVLLSGTLADSPRLWALPVPGWREKHHDPDSRTGGDVRIPSCLPLGVRNTKTKIICDNSKC